MAVVVAAVVVVVAVAVAGVVVEEVEEEVSSKEILALQNLLQVRKLPNRCEPSTFIN